MNLRHTHQCLKTQNRQKNRTRIKKTNKQTNKWEQNKQRNELKQKQQQQQQRDEFVSQPAARIISTSSPFNIYFNKLIFLFIFTWSEWQCKWHRNTFKRALVHKTFVFFVESKVSRNRQKGLTITCWVPQTHNCSRIQRTVSCVGTMILIRVFVLAMIFSWSVLAKQR